MSARDEVVLNLVDKMRFLGDTRSGHAVIVDTSVEAGGDEMGARPMEMVLVALGSCMGMDAMSILRKMRQDVRSYQIRLEGERAVEHPRIFTSIAMTHRFHGSALAEASVARAIQLSMTRYCPVYAMLNDSVHIVVRYEVTDDATGAVATGEAQVELTAGQEASLH